MKAWLRSAGAYFASPLVTIWMLFHVRKHARVLSRTLLPALAALAFVQPILALPVAHAAAPNCQGRIVSGTNVIADTPYDPYSALENTATYRIGVSNIGGDACQFALIFRNPSATPKLSAILTYALSAQGAPSLLAIGAPETSPSARTAAPLASGANGQIEFRVTIPRGQFAPPGDYTDTLDIDLYALDDTGHLASTALQTTRLPLTYPVVQMLSVNLKGTSTASTTAVHFGTLAKGQQATVEIQARANAEYQLEVTSEHGGALALTPPVPGQNWSVPYRASLGSQPLDLTAATSLLKQPATRPESDASFPLVVTIGDTTAKRAGRYEDTITIEIRPAKL